MLMAYKFGYTENYLWVKSKFVGKRIEFVVTYGDFVLYGTSR